ncbi:MAG: hypothetical protein WBI17_12270 [Clostridiaceae bacterium]
MEEKTRIKILRYAIGILALFLLVYLPFFLQKGIVLDESFLRKTQTESETIYSGKVNRVKTTIMQKGEVSRDSSIIVKVVEGNEPEKVFTINILDMVKNELGERYSFSVKEPSGEVSKFGYNSREIHPLTDEAGRPIFVIDHMVFSFGEEERTPMQNLMFKVVRVAFGDANTIRGNVGYFIFALLFLVMTLIDIRWPLFFFTVDHFLFVRDPEPSDLYLAIQKGRWIVSPVISVFLFAMAMFDH